LTELRQWNVAHQKAGAIKYGQANLDVSDEMDVELDRSRYRADRAKDLRLATVEGIDAVMKKHQLDALLFPAGTGAGIAAKAGYPSVMVPFALVKNAPTPPFPEGWNAKPSPFGVTFTGHGLQRAAPDRAGLRLRAGHAPPGAAALHALIASHPFPRAAAPVY
jgi:amidase